MGYLLSLYCIINVILFFIVTKKTFNPFSILNFWWGIGITLSTFGLYGIKIPEPYTYFIFFIGLFFYNLGGFFLVALSRDNVKHLKSEQNEKKITYVIIERVVNIFMLISLIILILRSITVLKMVFLMGYSYENIRYYYFYTELIISGYGHLINQYLIVPIIIIGATFLTYQKMMLRISNKVSVMLLIFLVFLHAFSSGGRLIFIYATLSIIFSVIMSGNSKINQENLSKLIKVFSGVIVLITIMYFFTTFRGNDSFEEVIRTFILYFTGSYAYFERIISFQMDSQINLYGLAFFGGIADTFGLFSNILGIEYISSSSVIAEYNQLYLDLGNHNYFNAFPTYMYTFMYDYGILGLIIGSLLFGLVTSLWYKNYLNYRSFSNLLLYIVIIVLVYESTMRWYGIFSTPWLIIMFALFVKLIDKINFGSTKYE